MEKKMTSGEMARKAGVSQKAIRLYDEKGLLKPTEYSEGNYRLYDDAALQILEKIVALKQIGFSLEEIRDNLKSGEASDIKGALEIQLQKMEEKKYQLEKITDAKEIVEKMKEYYKAHEKVIAGYENKLLAYFEDIIEKDGEFVLEARSQFWHCYKK
jgi:DNA-binding transcriptional MerR regulator